MLRGHCSHRAPRPACWGVPVCTKRATLRTIRSDSSIRPGRFARLKAKENTLLPKLWNTNGRSIACTAPYTSSNGAGSSFQPNW